ncbi:hypothetical protein D3C85_1888980 [compost metagenome]
MQLAEHFQLALDAALFATQITLLSRGVLTSVRVALGGDPLLLTAAQLLRDGFGQGRAGCWLDTVQ